MPHVRSIHRVVMITGAALIVLPTAMPAMAQSAAPKGKDKYDITLATTPNPPKTGDATFTVMVKGPDGKPVTDADVIAMFYMAAMPAMTKMPEMKNNVALKHEAAGKYVGKGQVMMAGNWDVTVMVKRGGKEVASKKFNVAAQS